MALDGGYGPGCSILDAALLHQCPSLVVNLAGRSLHKLDGRRAAGQQVGRRRMAARSLASGPCIFTLRHLVSSIRRRGRATSLEDALERHVLLRLAGRGRRLQLAQGCHGVRWMLCYLMYVIVGYGMLLDGE